MSVQVERGLLLMQQGRLELAEGAFRQALAEDPNDSRAHAFLAICLAHRKELKAATTEAAESIRLAPADSLGHSVLAHILAERNRHAEAESAIREAIRLNPYDADHHGTLAGIKLERRDWPAALDAAEHGLSIDPSHVRCTNLRAMALVKLGRRAEAGATIDTALAHDPDNAVTHANQGWTLLHAGQHRKALDHFREALRLEPGMEWAQLGIVEALKARNPIYRWMLLYFLWMSRLGAKAQWGIILGGYFGYMLLRTTLRNNPQLAPILLPVIVAYVIFVILTWLADPLFNLLLRFNRFGKYALSREQTWGSNLLAILFAGCVAMLGAWWATGRSAFLHGALLVGLLALPASSIFRLPKGWPRNVVVAACSALLVLAGLAFFLELSGDSLSGQAQIDRHDAARALRGLMTTGTLVTAIAANAVGSAQVRQ